MACCSSRPSKRGNEPVRELLVQKQLQADILQPRLVKSGRKRCSIPPDERLAIENKVNTWTECPWSFACLDAAS
jgi:hypothetical protein